MSQMEVAISSFGQWFLKKFPSVKSVSISLDDNQETAVSVTRQTKHLLTTDEIINVVCNYFSVDKANVLGKKRDDKTIQVRHISIYLIRKYIFLSFPKIGEIFKKDHTTILHAFSSINYKATKDKTLNSNLEILAGYLENNYVRPRNINF